ncbi:MAG: PEP-CTERM sorting domain-containing protein [Aquincola sp.]|nr:PEP-CTERM sorting domain-containing protein [Aquincola sp.]
MNKLFRCVLTMSALSAVLSAHAGPVIIGTHDASTLSTAIGGAGVTISNATFSTNGSALLPFAAGTFTGGAPSVGFDSGVVLTTGTIACAGGTNTSTGCGLSRGGSFDTTSLKFDFTSATGNVFFQYVFGSEEYNEFVNSQFNDQFSLLLNGVNIAVVPGGGGVVSINNVNCNSNSAFYRNNSSGPCANQGLSIEYDGLTSILTATGSVVAGATNSFEFRVFDRGDNILDSGVFIRAGSFSGNDNNDTPEPSTLLLSGLALVVMGKMRRRKAAR